MYFVVFQLFPSQLNNSLTDNCKFHKLSIALVGETISFFFVIAYDLKQIQNYEKGLSI